MHEMELVHRRIYELEQQQLQIKAKYVQWHLLARSDLRRVLTINTDMMKKLHGCDTSWNPVVETSLTLAARLTLLLSHLHRVLATVEVAYSEV